MRPMKRVSKPPQFGVLAEWHKHEEERRRSEKMNQELKTATGKKRRRLEKKMMLETAAAKKRSRLTGARGGSKSEAAKKERKVNSDGDDGVSHESTPRAHNGRAKRTAAGKRVPMRDKGTAQGKKVKFETPAMPSTEEDPVAQPKVQESTTNSKKEGRLSKMAGMIESIVKFYSPRHLLVSEQPSSIHVRPRMTEREPFTYLQFDDLTSMVEVVEPRFSRANFESFVGMGQEEFFQRYCKSLRVIKSGGHLHLEWSGA